MANGADEWGGDGFLIPPSGDVGNALLALQPELATIRAQVQQGLGKARGAIDIRVPGRPDTLTSEDQWVDWSIVKRAYCGMLSPDMLPGMRTAEGRRG